MEYDSHPIPPRADKYMNLQVHLKKPFFRRTLVGTVLAYARLNDCCDGNRAKEGLMRAEKFSRLVERCDVVSDR